MEHELLSNFLMDFSQNILFIPFSYSYEVVLEVSLTPLPPHQQKVGSESGFVSWSRNSEMVYNGLDGFSSKVISL